MDYNRKLMNPSQIQRFSWIEVSVMAGLQDCIRCLFNGSSLIERNMQTILDNHVRGSFFSKLRYELFHIQKYYSACSSSTFLSKQQEFCQHCLTSTSGCLSFFNKCFNFIPTITFHLIMSLLICT